MGRVSKGFGSWQGSHANNANVGGSSGHVGEDVGRLEVVGQSNFDASNNMEHEGLDGAIASTVEIAEE